MQRKNIFKNIIRSNTELGFGEKLTETGSRIMNQDGTFNIHRMNTKYHFYIDFVTMPWWKFFTYVFLFYGSINFVFALVYFLIGPEHVFVNRELPWHVQFFECYNFSAQTMTTVGYGGLHPVGFWAQTISIIEMITGILCFAVATGLVYSRFSRPTAAFKFSEKAIIAPYQDINSFQIRVANRRRNLLMEIEAQVMMAIDVLDDNGNSKRIFVDLALERNKIYFLPLSWTIVHPINSSSPLYGKSAQDLIDSNAEILILIKAYDDTFSQVVHANTSYLSSEIIWGAKFKPTFYSNQGRPTIFEIDKLGEIVNAELNNQKENISPPAM